MQSPLNLLDFLFNPLGPSGRNNFEIRLRLGSLSVIGNDLLFASPMTRGSGLNLRLLRMFSLMVGI